MLERREKVAQAGSITVPITFHHSWLSTTIWELTPAPKLAPIRF